MQCLLFQDEECLRPGEATDLSFLEKLEEKVGDHAHFVTYAFTLCIFPSHIQGWAGNNLCLVPEGIKQPIQMLESSTGGSGGAGRCEWDFFFTCVMLSFEPVIPHQN